MKTKEEIVKNWLPRYTKRPLEDFSKFILLTNFDKYVELFAERFQVPVLGYDANMTSATADGMTIINFGMGSPNAAIIMDLLGAIEPKACLFLGKCGGIDQKNNQRLMLMHKICATKDEIMMPTTLLIYLILK